METTIIMKMKGVIRCIGQTPEKVRCTGEFVTVAKFGGLVLCCLASNVVRQIGRQMKTTV